MATLREQLSGALEEAEAARREAAALQRERALHRASVGGGGDAERALAPSSAAGGGGGASQSAAAAAAAAQAAHLRTAVAGSGAPHPAPPSSAAAAEQLGAVLEAERALLADEVVRLTGRLQLLQGASLQQGGGLQSFHSIPLLPLPLQAWRGASRRRRRASRRCSPSTTCCWSCWVSRAAAPGTRPSHVHTHTGTPPFAAAGEREEQLDEERADLEEVKGAYRVQLEELMLRVAAEGGGAHDAAPPPAAAEGGVR